jgi:hypothetical protein
MVCVVPNVGPFSFVKLANILTIVRGKEMKVVMRVLDEMVILLEEHQI